jgi:hypothetical protein
VVSNITQFTEYRVLQEVAENGVAYLKVEADGSVSEVSLEIFLAESVYFLAAMYRMQQTIHDTRLGDYMPMPHPTMHAFLDIPQGQLATWAQKQRYEVPR